MKAITPNDTEHAVFSKFAAVIPSFISLLGSWGIVLFIMRMTEWLLNGCIYQFPEKSFLFFVSACISDILFVCKAGTFLFILFFPSSFISLAIARKVFLVAAVLISIGYFALLQYFNSTLVLLGSDLYGYSAKDIQQTVGASGRLNIVTVMILLFVIVSVIVSIKWASRRIHAGKVLSAVLITGIIMIALFSKIVSASAPSFQKEYDANLAKNKIDYFINSSWNHFFPKLQELDIYADNYLEDGGTLFSYIDEKKFPFLRSDTAEDVLSPFFTPAGKAPDIVMIVVEGLGRVFTNEGAYLGNFTPFLDSLSQHSLYWENFLSGSGRTFAVLPTVLGSLPFGKNGFTEMENMPGHLSLPAILKKNGYSTSFYYAGDASFDKMDQFMQKQGIDKIRDKKTFPAGYESLPANNGFSWGYGDKELFRFFLDKKGQENPDQPSLTVLLTIATHSPFLIPGQTFYERQFEQRMSALHFKEEQKRSTGHISSNMQLFYMQMMP